MSAYAYYSGMLLIHYKADCMLMPKGTLAVSAPPAQQHQQQQ
jgi:hypothetical protein